MAQQEAEKLSAEKNQHPDKDQSLSRIFIVSNLEENSKQTEAQIQSKKIEDSKTVEEQISDIEKKPDLNQVAHEEVQPETKEVVTEQPAAVTENITSTKPAAEKAMKTSGEGVVDENGIVYLSVAQLNDIYVESRVSNEQKAYIPYKIAKKYGLTDKSVKAVNVNGLIIPIEEITKKGYNQELRVISKEEKDRKRKARLNQKQAEKNSLF